MFEKHLWKSYILSKDTGHRLKYLISFDSIIIITLFYADLEITFKII